MLEENKSFVDLAKDWGVTVPEVSQPKVVNTGTGFFDHKAGKYKVIVLAFEEKFNKDDGGKKVAAKKDEPGAKPYGQHRFCIVADPNGRLLKDDFTPMEGMTYGQMVFNQYVTYDPDKQFSNKNLYGNFFIDGLPQVSVIQGEKNDYEVIFGNLGFFYGAVATMELTDEYKGKKTRAFISNLELDDHTLTQEKLGKRKKVADKLSLLLNEMRATEEQARANKKKDGGSGAASVAPESSDEGDSLLSKYT